jgi:RimJ/RimL family protein N-acetyltransferase
VATAALRLVAGWAFQELGVERLQLTTHPDNAASQRVAAKAGFSREGTLRAWLVTRDGRRDAVMFSLLPGDPATRT